MISFIFGTSSDGLGNVSVSAHFFFLMVMLSFNMVVFRDKNWEVNFSASFLSSIMTFLFLDLDSCDLIGLVLLFEDVSSCVTILVPECKDALGG